MRALCIESARFPYKYYYHYSRIESLRSQFYEAKCDYFRVRIVYTKRIQIHARDCNGAISNISECEISSSHSGEYEAQNLLGCTAVFLIECRPTFQRYVLPPSPE
jgi:hypothetical protein